MLAIYHLTVANYYDTPTNFDIEPDYSMTGEAFLEGLRDIHIGEWRRHYDASDYGVHVLDGTQWELTIEYADGRKAEFAAAAKVLAKEHKQLAARDPVYAARQYIADMKRSKLYADTLMRTAKKVQRM